MIVGQMMVAIVNGMIGLILGLLVGTKILGFDFGQTLFLVGVSNFAALIALITTLQAEKTQWIRKFVLNRSLKTWSALLLIYFTILFGFFPVLMDWKKLLFMIVPLVMSSGFSIVVFGPIQDFLVSRSQRKLGQ